MNEKDMQAFDDELTAMAARLERDIEPGADLWPGIEAAIGEQARDEVNSTSAGISPWTRYLAQAAAVILLVGGSSGLTYLAMSGDDRRVTPAPGDSAMPLNVVSASFGDRYTLGPDFQDARSDLESRLQSELERLSPEARAEVERNMATIRGAIDEINDALTNEPDNMLLQELLLSSYQEELALMRKVNGITNTVMLRQDM